MPIETEIKIKVDSHQAVTTKLEQQNAIFHGSVYQKDCYFDNDTSDMVKLDCCLRLRSESDSYGNVLKSVLCYKGRKMGGKVKTRSEIETFVSEPTNTEQILTSLGYSISLSFNKKRTIWFLNDCEVCLDELPIIGFFVEIEGPDEAIVIKTAEILGIGVGEQEHRSYACLIDSILKEKSPELREVYLEEDTAQDNVKVTNFEFNTPPGVNGLAHILINPSSGTGFASTITEKLKDYLSSQGLSVNVDTISEFSDIGRLVEKATNSPGCKLIAACGGDGTIREVIQNLRGSDKPLMILPGGTENLLAHELGNDKNINTYKMMFEKNIINPLDIATVNGCCFTSVLGIGFDAEIVELLSKRRNGNITHSDYIWPIWRTFWTHELPAFAVEADGEEVFRGSGMMFAGNISRYATGLRILKDADFSDGLLDLCIYPCKNKSDILKHFSMTMLQIHTKSAEVVYKKFRRLRVVPLNDQILTQIDGDPGPSLPLEIEISPSAVQVYNMIKV